MVWIRLGDAFICSYFLFLMVVQQNDYIRTIGTFFYWALFLGLIASMTFAIYEFWKETKK